MKTKICTKCNKEKKLNEFYKNRADCKICNNKKSKEYRDSHKKETAKYLKEYRNNNKEKCAKQNKQWQKDNKERTIKRKKQWKVKNKEKVVKYDKNYQDRNKEKIKQKRKENYKKNKKKILLKNKEYRDKNKEKQRQYLNNKYQNNINFKIIVNLRTRLYNALKNNTKSKRTLDLLGCSIEELKQHLEYQFAKGMSWDNYGDWHIDHRKPCALFDLSIPEEQRKYFNHKNLQPLWAIDNLSKGSKYVVPS